MNAASQEMFEAVHAVVSGRTREDNQVRDLAYRVAEASTAVRRRVDRAVGYARAGLRLEASAEADADPSVFEMAAAFETDEFKAWRSHCAKRQLPLPDVISPEAILEIEEAAAQLAPLRNRLAQMRRLVLADASVWHRLETLRELIARDPDNPAWEEDRRAMEPAAADELGERFEHALRVGDLEAAQECVERLQDGRWHSGGAARIAAPLRTRLDAEFSARLVAQAREVATQLDAEWAAESEAGARAGLEEWRGLEQQLLGYGGEMPGELLARIDAVEGWLSGREHMAEQLREHRDRSASLERVAMDESSTLAQIRQALRAAEQTVEGVPEDVRAIAQRRIEEFERRGRMRRMVVVSSVVLALIVAAAGAFLAVRHTTESNRVDSIAAAIQAQVKAGELDQAQKLLDDALTEPLLAGDERIVRAREAIVAARAPLIASDERFALAVTDAGDPEHEDAKPLRMEEAKELARTPEQQTLVANWQRRFGRATQERLDARVQRAMERVRTIATEIAAAQPSADASWDGTYANWEAGLADVERADGSVGGVRAETERARTLLAAQRAKTTALRVEAARRAKLAGLGVAAATPASLAAALEAYNREYPESAEAAEFTQALLGAPLWQSVVALGTLAPRPSVALAAAPQPERSAVAAALDAYVTANPTSPLGQQVAQLRALLESPAPETVPWRGWLTEKLGALEEFGLYALERRDGTRFYSRQDPRKVPWQDQGSARWKSVLCISGKTGKESFERFDQSQLKYEGPAPQVALATQVRDLFADTARTPNAVEGALAMLALFRESDAVDGAFLVTITRGLLESMAPDEPEPLRAQLESAAARLARVNAEEIDWKNPLDTSARARSRAAQAALREALQPDAWRRAYQSRMAEAVAPFTMPYQPAGVLMRGAQSEWTLLPAGGVPPAAGSALFVVDPGLGARPASIVRVGTIGDDGTARFDPTVSLPAAGTLVLLQKRGS